jgi:ureidoacrylate peracid hydrolase
MIEAEPEPISIDLSKTVVIVVDMQNDFASKGGMFDRAGIDISMVPSAIGSTKRVLAAARDAGIKIIYLKMGYRPDLSNAGPPILQTGSNTCPCVSGSKSVPRTVQRAGS